MVLKKIISGGQTGVDRAALDAAIQCGFPCGGWCPDGRSAEDGTIPARYPLQELKGGGYRERTLRNVADSDGTVIIYFGKLEGGTEETVRCCIEKSKPYKLIDADEIPAERAAFLIQRFVETHGIEILNVAGPRASKVPKAYGYVLETAKLLLSAISRK